MGAPPDYAWKTYRSADGLDLAYRDYGRPARDAPVLITLGGLTRNSADFEMLAGHFAAYFHILSPDYRGRGRSHYDPDPRRYVPPTYARDMAALMAHAGVARAVFVGTSLGGIVAMLLASSQPHLVQGAVLNDVGPELAPQALTRIGTMLSRHKENGPLADWAAAAEAAKAGNAVAFPQYGPDDWDRFARRLFRERSDGRVELAYDPNIMEAFQVPQKGAPPPDLWPAFQAMDSIPALVIRGGISDLLTPGIVARMKIAKPDLAITQVPGIGHAPMLDEPMALRALDRFLGQFTG